jgi:Lon-like protease
MPVALFSERSQWPEPQASAPRLGRRHRAGWLLLAIAAVLVFALGLVPSPYVIERPGPAFNTLGANNAVGDASAGHPAPLISIDGHKTYPTSGALDLLTVSVVGDPESLPSWITVIGAWFEPSKAVIPVEAAFPAGTTVEQETRQNKALMVDSQKDAVAAALNSLDIPFPQSVTVKTVIPKTPAVGRLHRGDKIVSVNGVKVHGVQSLRELLAKNGANRTAAIGIMRSGRSETIEVSPARIHSAVALGVGVGMDYTFPFHITIQLDNVGGPSAGQMFALGIIDRLTPGSLTGGTRVAGTGTIDNEGNIGPIGGIRQKMYGAQRAGARFFLAPKSNCDEVAGNVPSGLRVFAVRRLRDSLAALKAIKAGGDLGRLPSCAP